MVTIKKQREKTPDIVLPSKTELLYIIDQINDTNSCKPSRDKALIALEYLTGARVSELLAIKRLHIERKNIIGKDFLVINQMRVLKRRKPMLRTVLILIEKEKELCQIAINYIDSIGMEDRLFPMTRQRAWQIIDKHTGYFNHFFRHMRTTHLTVDYGFTAQELKKFFGWASSKMADSYSHLQVIDIAKKMSL